MGYMYNEIGWVKYVLVFDQFSVWTTIKYFFHLNEVSQIKQFSEWVVINYDFLHLRKWNREFVSHEQEP